METVFNEVVEAIKTYLPSFIGALAILVAGWVIAMIVAGLVRGLLKKLGLNSRLDSWTGIEGVAAKGDWENGIAKAIYYITMLFVLVAFFQTLQITLITEPLNRLLNIVFEFVPQLAGATILLIGAWVVAKLSRMLVLKGLTAANIDQRFAEKMEQEERPVPLSKTFSDAVYGLVFLLFLPAILEALSLDGLLAPVQGMINKVLDFLPNLLTAGIILVVGWFVARLVQQIVTNLLAAIGTDTLSDKIGLASGLGEKRLSSILGFILYGLMLIPVAIAALNTLQLESITAPASNMLSMFLAALPNIFAAAVVIGISYIIGRLVASLTTNLLVGIGFDEITSRLGFTRETAEGRWTPSRLAGHVVLLAIVFFSVLEASSLLGFEGLATLISHFMVLAGHILLGLTIFAIGMAIANLVAKAVNASNVARAGLYAATARISILIFAGAMALRQMGLANEIINLAFGLLLGSLALALAIAVGFGARDIAARELDQLLITMRSKKE